MTFVRDAYSIIAVIVNHFVNELENRSKNIYEVILSMTKECNSNCNLCQVEVLI